VLGNLSKVKKMISSQFKVGGRRERPEPNVQIQKFLRGGQENR